MSWFLDYVIRAKNDAKPVVQAAAKDLEQLEKATEETQKATERWSAAQQRAAMAMSGMHQQALKMNEALSKTSGLDKMKDAFVSLTSGGGVSGALSALGPAGVAAAAGFTAVGGAVALAGRELVKLAGQAEQWTNISKSTGLGVTQVQQLSALLEDAGIPAEALKKGMKALSDEVAAGGKQLEQFGVSIKGWDLMSQEQRLQAMAQVIADVEDPATKAALAAAAFGKSGTDLIPVMEDIAGGAYKLYDALDDGAVAGLAQADATIDAFTRKLDTVKKRFLSSAIGFAQGLTFLPGGVPVYIPPVPEGPVVPTKPTGPSPEERQRQEREAVNRTAEARKKAEREKAVAAGKAAREAQQSWEESNREVVEDLNARTREHQSRYKEDADASIAEVERTLREQEKAEQKKEDVHAAAVKDQLEVDRWLAQQREEQDQKEQQQLEQRYRDVMDVLDGVRELGDAIGGTFGSIVSAGAGAIQTFMSISKAIEQGASNTEKFAMGLSVLTSAYKSGSVGGGAMSGAAAGFAMGGGIGAVIGGIGGAIAGLFGKGKKEKEELAKVDALRKAFLETAGGLGVLKERAERAGISLDKMLNAKNAKDYEAALKDVQRALDLQDQAYADTQAAIEKYGLTIDQLGPKWRQQELDKQAGSLLKDYELLKAAGVDQAVLIEKMGANLNEYVNTAVRAGAEIPQAMKPTIDLMYEQGRLLHEDGSAYTEAEYAALKYGQTTSEQMKSMLEAIYALVKVLGGDVPAAFDKMGEAAERNGQRARNNMPSGSEYMPTGDRGNPQEDPTDMARGGVILPFVQRAAKGLYAPSQPGGMLARVGEGGKDELVLPVQAVLDNALRIAAAAGGGPQVNHIYIGAEKLDTFILNRTRTGHMRVDGAGVRRRG